MEGRAKLSLQSRERPTSSANFASLLSHGICHFSYSRGQSAYGAAATAIAGRLRRAAGAQDGGVAARTPHVARVDGSRGAFRAARGKSAIAFRGEIGSGASAIGTGRIRGGPARFDRRDAFAHRFYGHGTGGRQFERSDRRAGTLAGGARGAAAKGDPA